MKSKTVESSLSRVTLHMLKNDFKNSSKNDYFRKRRNIIKCNKDKKIKIWIQKKIVDMWPVYNSKILIFKVY